MTRRSFLLRTGASVVAVGLTGPAALYSDSNDPDLQDRVRRWRYTVPEILPHYGPIWTKILSNLGMARPQTSFMNVQHEVEDLETLTEACNTGHYQTYEIDVRYRTDKLVVAHGYFSPSHMDLDEALNCINGGTRPGLAKFDFKDWLGFAKGDEVIAKQMDKPYVNNINLFRGFNDAVTPKRVTDRGLRRNSVLWSMGIGKGESVGAYQIMQAVALHEELDGDMVFPIKTSQYMHHRRVMSEYVKHGGIVHLYNRRRPSNEELRVITGEVPPHQAVIDWDFDA